MPNILEQIIEAALADMQAAEDADDVLRLLQIAHAIIGQLIEAVQATPEE